MLVRECVRQGERRVKAASHAKRKGNDLHEVDERVISVGRERGKGCQSWEEKG